MSFVLTFFLTLMLSTFLPFHHSTIALALNLKVFFSPYTWVFLIRKKIYIWRGILGGALGRCLSINLFVLIPVLTLLYLPVTFSHYPGNASQGWHLVRGRAHPGQVARQSRGWHRDRQPFTLTSWSKPTWKKHTSPRALLLRWQC